MARGREIFIIFHKSPAIFILSRIVINPDKRPYNMSEVILWTLDTGNTANTLEMENDNEECYYFERLQRVLATQVDILLGCEISNNILI